MSRHELTARADRPDVGVAYIGWDRPLRTFFVQIYARADADEPMLWRGTRVSEIAYAHNALAIAKRFAVVPDGLAEQLANERAADAGVPDGAALLLLKSAGIVR